MKAKEQNKSSGDGHAMFPSLFSQYNCILKEFGFSEDEFGTKSNRSRQLECPSHVNEHQMPKCRISKKKLRKQTKKVV